MPGRGDRPDLGGGGPVEVLDRYPATAGMVMACALLLGHAVHRGGLLDPDAQTLLDLGAVHWPLVAREPWRLLVAPFLHTGPLHLVVNAFALWQVGRQLEVHLGSSRLWCVLLACGVAGGLGSIAGQLVSGGGASVGASSAVCGLLALACVIARRAPERLRSLERLAGPWLAAALLLGALVPRVDLGGHLGGALAGAAFGAWIDVRPGAGDVKGWGWVAVGLSLLVLAAVGVTTFTRPAG